MLNKAYDLPLKTGRSAMPVEHGVIIEEIAAPSNCRRPSLSAVNTGVWCGLLF